jgi:hypothetical protein
MFFKQLINKPVPGPSLAENLRNRPGAMNPKTLEQILEIVKKENPADVSDADILANKDQIISILTAVGHLIAFDKLKPAEIEPAADYYENRNRKPFDKKNKPFDKKKADEIYGPAADYIKYPEFGEPAENVKAKAEAKAKNLAEQPLTITVYSDDDGLALYRPVDNIDVSIALEKNKITIPSDDIEFHATELGLHTATIKLSREFDINAQVRVWVVPKLNQNENAFSRWQTQRQPNLKHSKFVKGPPPHRDDPYYITEDLIPGVNSITIEVEADDEGRLMHDGQRDALFPHDISEVIEEALDVKIWPGDIMIKPISELGLFTAKIAIPLANGEEAKANLKIWVVPKN